MPSAAQRHATLFQTYAERSEAANLSPLATYLLRLVHIKKTNLCVSADVRTTTELLQLAEEVGEHICILKTHSDIIKDFGDKTIRGLNEVARRKGFLIFEDRKFMDIGSTVQEQYVGGDHCIVRWASITNAALFSGASVIVALEEAAQRSIAAHNSSVQTDISASPAPSAVGAEDHESSDEDDDDDQIETNAGDGDDTEEDDEEPSLREERPSRKQSVVSVSTTIITKSEAISPPSALRPSLSREATEESEGESDDDQHSQLAALGPAPYHRSLLLLAQMSSKDNWFGAEYTQFCVSEARKNKAFVMGFIAQKSLNTEKDDNFITMTPGVQLAAGGDGLGQQYNTPRSVVGENGSDIIIVGRGILAASDRRRAAFEYRKQGWLAYEERIRGGRRKR